MKISVILSLFCTISLSAAMSYSQETKLNIDITNASVSDLLNEIGSKSDFSFWYKTSEVKNSEKINLKVTNQTVDKILDLALKGLGLDYVIKDKVIIVFDKQEGNLKARDNIVVRGVVTDAGNGQTMPGVNIVIEGTTTGVVSDLDGKYTIEAGSPDAVLVFSFVGYVTEKIPVNGRSIIDVALVADIQSLEEVVLIGYQTIKKKDLTGTVSVVSTEETSRVSSTSLAQSIQGLTAGVTVRNSGSTGVSKIEIRGVASYTNSDPLYVIDGMVADANLTINSDDIESIQILKDASASAIYGARAANGVVIITTKQGKKGPMRVSFSGKIGVQQIPKVYDVMDNTQYSAMKMTQFENSSPNYLTAYAPQIARLDTNVYNTNWQNEMLRNGAIENYHISFSGGNETSVFLASASYMNQKSYVVSDDFKRYSFRINTQSTRGILTFGENIVFSNTTIHHPGTGNVMYDMNMMLPIIPVRDSLYITTNNPRGYGIGTTNAVTYAYNPVAVKELWQVTPNYSKLVGNIFAELKFTKWLSYKFNFGTEASFDYVKNIRKDGIYQYNASPYPSSIIETRSVFLSLLTDHTLNFDKTFGKQNINGVIGINQQHTSNKYTRAGKTNLQKSGDDYLTTIDAATGEFTSYGGVWNDYKILGYLGRVNYKYDDKYLLTFTSRLDYDSRFGENYRRGFFPSLAAAWRISKESFFTIDWVNDLKINASIGKLGIVTADSWGYTAFINSNPRAIFGADQSPYVGAYQAKLANPDLHWEERVTQNIGLDAALFENAFLVSLAYYSSLSKDCLLQLPVAGYLGNLGGNPYVNAGSISNKGLEFAATLRNKQHDFKWEVSANFTTIKNEVVSVGYQGEGIDYLLVGRTRSQVGYPLGQWYLIKTDGLFQSEDEILEYTSDGTLIQPFATPGDVKYVDFTPDGQINDEDRQYVGSPWPKLQTGGQVNLSYRQFSMNMQLVGIFGYTIYNDIRKVLDSYQNTNFRSDISPWSETNTNTDDPRMGLEQTQQGIVQNNWGNTDRWLENGSYLRLRNLEFSYAISPKLLERVKIQNARIYVSGQNIFTFTKYSGLDPDVVGSGILERGYDNGNWPSPKVYSVGIECTF
ncbi:MAG: TonB-dependent receptor [Bacteroidales bacterium]|nr:TonB-dependent receptor [Bacteroidales bacterium]